MFYRAKPSLGLDPIATAMIGAGVNFVQGWQQNQAQRASEAAAQPTPLKQAIAASTAALSASSQSAATAAPTPFYAQPWFIPAAAGAGVLVLGLIVWGLR